MHPRLSAFSFASRSSMTWGEAQSGVLPPTRPFVEEGWGGATAFQVAIAAAALR